MGCSAAPSSRRPWQPMCIVTLCGNVAPVSVTPSMSCRNSVSSNTRRPMPTIRGSGSAWPKNTRHIAVHEADGQTIHRCGSKTSQKWWITPPRFVPIARVERRLAAAGLLGRIHHRHAVAFQQVRGGLGDLRIELVDVAGDEQRHRLARTIGRIVLPRRNTLGWLTHRFWPGKVLGAREIRYFILPGRVVDQGCERRQGIAGG